MKNKVNTGFRSIRKFTQFETNCKKGVRHMRHFKRYLATITCLPLLMTFSAFAAQKVDASSPSVYIKAETYQFHPVLEGTEIKHTFLIKNRGNAPLEIVNVRTD